MSSHRHALGHSGALNYLNLVVDTLRPKEARGFGVFVDNRQIVDIIISERYADATEVGWRVGSRRQILWLICRLWPTMGRSATRGWDGDVDE